MEFMKNCKTVVLLNSKLIISLDNGEERSGWFWKQLLESSRDSKLKEFTSIFSDGSIKKLEVNAESANMLDVKMVVEWKGSDEPETILFMYSGEYLVEWGKPMPVPFIQGVARRKD